MANVTKVPPRGFDAEMAARRWDALFGGEAARGAVVLVAEDDPAVRKVVGSTLQRAGHSVVLARNATEALTMLRRFTVDLLIADIILPDMTGVDLAAAGRQLRPGVRVLFISGYGAEVLEERGLEGVDLLEKPFSPGVLRLKVQEALSK